MALDYGPVGVWAGAVMSAVLATIAVLVALGYFERFRAPRLRMTFEQREPWVREASYGGETALWIRVGVENVGKTSARGCVGRLTAVHTDRRLRSDIDPLQLRWAGLPRSDSFTPLDLRRGEREFLNVVCRDSLNTWQLVTFDDEDFDPGFSLQLGADQEHLLDLTIYADNAVTSHQMVIDVAAGGTSITVALRKPERTSPRA